MEFNHREEGSINSSEEVDQPEQDNSDVGRGRSYECVFCKRGFTTAQALGGHMNIHRKDRAKNRPSTLIHSNKVDEYYTGPRFYQPISSFPTRYVEDHQAQMNYRTYFPASTSSERPLFYENYHHNNHSHDQNLLSSIPFGEDWRMSLTLQFGEALVEDGMEKKRRDRNEEDELDLELRLGHHP